MKNLTRRLLSVSIAVLVFISSASVILAEDNVRLVEPTDSLEYLSHRSPTKLKLYKDSALTEQIIDDDLLPIGEKIYYTLESEEGYRMIDFRSTADYMDKNFMILSSKEVEFDFHEVLMGDFDDNGIVDFKDVMWILRWCSHWNHGSTWTIEENGLAGDYNNDGSIYLKDVAGILKMLAGWGNDYGGVQSDFEAIVEIEYETAETIATTGDYDDYHSLNTTIIDSAEEFKAYWDAASDVITLPDFFYEDWVNMPEELYDTSYVNECYPLDREALYSKYNDEFFTQHNIVIGSIITWAAPESDFDSFKFVNGVATVQYQSYRSGVLVEPCYTLNQIIIIDKDDLSKDDVVRCREVYDYNNC